MRNVLTSVLRGLMSAGMLWVVALGCQRSSEHAIYDKDSGLRAPLPARWTQWDAQKLKSPEAVRAHLVAYAGDPEKKATVSVRRFAYQRPFAKVAVTGDNVDRLRPEDRETFLNSLEKEVERDLADGTEFWEFTSSSHSESMPRGYFVEVVGQSREPGHVTLWVKSLLLLPKGSAEILEVRLMVPVSERGKYQLDLGRIEGGIEQWIRGPAR